MRLLNYHSDCALVLKGLNIKNSLTWFANCVSGDMVTGVNINFKTRHRYLCRGSIPVKYNAIISPKEIDMYDKKKLDELKDSLEKWEGTSLQKALSSLPERADQFITTSSEPINRLYTPLDVPDMDYAASLGLPGEYPFTRGIHPTLHRSKLWTMRMFAGFGTAEETNARF